MNKLMMKARAGVTLVELLVVILIVTILSVSMLPMLQPFVTEAQYAAEPIPVIGNLRTKIGLYQYDKGSLPTTTGGSFTNVVQTWMAKTDDSEKYVPASYELSALATGYSPSSRTEWTSDTDKAQHIGTKCDIDYQDLKGKRSKPLHYQYFVLNANNNPSYVVGCFGNGDGLKSGTGYAVCEINFTGAGKKYIGTWKRYKQSEDESPIEFNSDPSAVDESGKPVGCYIPTPDDFDTAATTAASEQGKPGLITNMEAAGWEF